MRESSQRVPGGGPLGKGNEPTNPRMKPEVFAAVGHKGKTTKIASFKQRCPSLATF